MSVAAVAALAHCSTPFSTTDKTRRGYLRDHARTFAGPPERPVIIVAGFGVTRLFDPESDFYDWRLSARETSARLAHLVDRVRNGGKVDIVAHSAGALVAVAYVKLHGGQSVENLILIAPASGGVVDAFRVFVRPEKLIRRELKPEVVATWPFIFELLPENGRVFIDEEGRPLERDLWDAGSWPFDVRRQLASARALRHELRAKQAEALVLAGDCVPTATRILQRRDGTYAFYPDDLRPHEEALAGLLFEPGDGTIPVSSASSAGEPLLFCDGHQGIAADPNVHRALIRRLRH